MITLEKLSEILDGDTNYQSDTDRKLLAITTLRSKIPFDVCHSIIQGADHDVVYLCDIDEALPYISEDDAKIIANGGVFIDTDSDSLSMYV